MTPGSHAGGGILEYPKRSVVEPSETAFRTPKSDGLGQVGNQLVAMITGASHSHLGAAYVVSVSEGKGARANPLAREQTPRGEVLGKSA
jgi:hypothetical protein